MMLIDQSQKTCRRVGTILSINDTGELTHTACRDMIGWIEGLKKPCNSNEVHLILKATLFPLPRQETW